MTRYAKRKAIRGRGLLDFYEEQKRLRNGGSSTTYAPRRRKEVDLGELAARLRQGGTRATWGSGIGNSGSSGSIIGDLVQDSIGEWVDFGREWHDTRTRQKDEINQLQQELARYKKLTGQGIFRDWVHKIIPDKYVDYFRGPVGWAKKIGENTRDKKIRGLRGEIERQKGIYDVIQRKKQENERYQEAKRKWEQEQQVQGSGFFELPHVSEYPKADFLRNIAEIQEELKTYRGNGCTLKPMPFSRPTEDWRLLSIT